jgi:hypothetical protein
VFAVEWRQNLIQPDHKEEIHNYITGIVRNWQEGFGAFSYSHSHLDKVIGYIRNQEKHHGKTSFKKEYMMLLRKFDVVFEPSYLFDFPQGRDETECEF